MTPRLIIRDFFPEDADALYEYLSDPEVTRYEPYEPFSRGKARFEARARSLNKAYRAVALRDDASIPGIGAPGVYHTEPVRWGRVIGNLYIERHAFDMREIGFVFARQYWGQGYARESAEAAISAAFEDGAHRICAECCTLNERSWRLMERLGMRREGCTLKSVALGKDEGGNPVWYDTYTYAVLDEEWQDAHVLKRPLWCKWQGHPVPHSPIG